MHIFMMIDGLFEVLYFTPTLRTLHNRHNMLVQIPVLYRTESHQKKGDNGRDPVVGYTV